jgi:hypothetical protein
VAAVGLSTASKADAGDAEAAARSGFRFGYSQRLGSSVSAQPGGEQLGDRASAARLG